MNAAKKMPGGNRAGAMVGDLRAQSKFAPTGTPPVPSTLLLDAACTCRGAGRCPTCQAWTARMWLQDLINAARG